ncbi:unnamed protein product [Caenorhabditis angaria]|uniref:Uncharacterized protein n=1 Tax=Caenorhabditis angaria TaxID=860376 RepID=A0A9P1I2Q5_9PELO|nr:unnamed protein product [Caenorhabditis angaria]
MVNFLLITFIVQFCSKSKKQESRTSSTTDGGTPPNTVTPTNNSKKIVKSEEKIKDYDILEKEVTAQTPDTPELKYYDLDVTQKDELQRVNLKTKKIIKSNAAPSSASKHNKRNKLDRTQGLSVYNIYVFFRVDEINEDDDDTCQDAPSLEIRNQGPSCEQDTLNSRRNKNKKSREIVKKPSREPVKKDNRSRE